MMYADIKLITLATCATDLISYQNTNKSQQLPDPYFFEENSVQLVRFDISEVRYGIFTIPIDLGIPYSEYVTTFPSPINEKHLRFDSNGEYVFRRLDYKDKNMSFDAIKEELDHAAGNAQFFYDFMTGYVSGAIKRSTPLPWTRQEEYRKIYLTKELLTNGQARD